MKIIYLNTWDGKLEKELFDFLLKQSGSTDIFCLQEVSEKLFKKISNILLNFKGIRTTKEYINNWTFDVATFVKNDMGILRNIDNVQTKETGGLLISEIKTKDKKIIVANVHGLSMPGDKLDTKERLLQSKEIIDRLSGFSEPIIIGGDFNLDKDTESIAAFTNVGYINLINDFKIKRTRNKIAWEFHKDSQSGFFGKQKFCDYCFVTKNVKVKSFKVPDLAISDHLPLVLEFEV